MAVKIKKARNFSCISYLSKEEILSVLRQHENQLKYSAFILHDHDTWDENDEKKDSEHVAGTLKQEHFHLLLLLNYPYPLSSVKSWFKGFYDSDNLEVNTMVQECALPASAYRYLTHKDNPEKYQYNDSDIISSDPLYFGIEALDDEPDNSFSALEYLLNTGNVFETARRFGRDFIIHYSSYKLLCEDIAYFPRSYTPKVYDPEGLKIIKDK